MTQSMTEAEAVVVINEAVNTDLSKLIRDLLSNKDYKTLEVQATLAFVLASVLADSCYENHVPEERMCAVTSCFEHYIHSACHVMYEGFGEGVLAPGRKKSH